MNSNMSFEVHDKNNSSHIIEDFLEKFVEEQNFHTKAVALHSFAKSYLQSTAADSIEIRRNLSFKVILKVPELFAVLTHFNSPAPYNDRKDIKVINLQSATLCLEVLLMYQECSKDKEQLQSLLQIMLKVLYQAYAHCKDSEILYGDLLEDFTDQLAGFYQKIQDVQTVMMFGFEQLLTIDLYNMEDAAILSISDDLGKLCKLVCCLDAMIAAKLWRTFIKIISHFSRVVRDGLEVDTILSSLIATISDIIHECKFKLNNNEQVEEPGIKIFLFQINLVMKIFHIFHGCLDGSIRNLRTLVLELYSLLILCYSSFDARDDNQHLKCALINSFFPMISLFHSDNSFLTSAVQVVSMENNLPHLHLPHLLLKLTAFNYLNADTTSNYMPSDQRKEVLKGVFNILQKNKPEDDLKFAVLKLPQCIFHGQKRVERKEEQFITLYEESYHCLSEFCKIITDCDFNELADEMTECLTSCSEVVALLISDVWMYRLRCSSVEYLYTSCVNLSTVAFSTESDIYIKQHFKRMLKFLPFDKKLKLFDQCENNRSLSYYTQKVYHSYGIPHHYDTQVEVSNNSTELCQLMKEISKPVPKDEQNIVKKACNILELFSLMVDISQNSEILKFAELATFLFKTEIYEVQIAVLTFLKALKRKHLMEKSPDFRTTVSGLTVLLTEVLKSRNYIIRQEAFCTYTELARSTPHPEIAQGVVAQSPELVPVIKSYIIKDPLPAFLTEKERLENLQKQLRASTLCKEPQLLYSESCKKILFCFGHLFHD